MKELRQFDLCEIDDNSCQCGSVDHEWMPKICILSDLLYETKLAAKIQQLISASNITNGDYLRVKSQSWLRIVRSKKCLPDCLFYWYAANLPFPKEINYRILKKKKDYIVKPIVSKCEHNKKNVRINKYKNNIWQINSEY